MKRELTTAKISLSGIIVGLLLSVAFLFLVCPAPRGGKESAMRSADLSNLKQLAIANQMYMEEHDGYGPQPSEWMDKLLPFINNERILRSPREGYNEEEYGYAYLLELGGLQLSEVSNPEDVPVVFDSSDFRRNVAGDLDHLPDPPRYGAWNNIAFLDAHAKGYKTAPEFKIELP